MRLVASMASLLWLRLVVAFPVGKTFPERPCSDICDVIASRVTDSGARYACECHNITTPDGFVMQTVRMPARKPNSTKLPVFLMHGFLTSAIDWVAQPRARDSLPYLLSDAGYDVWLGNNRGNVFSVHNEKMDINTVEFWDAVDFDNMADQDVPVIFDYVLNSTGAPKLHWVGHSQGGGVLVFALAEKPLLKDRLATSVLLAPGVHMKNLKVPLLKNMARTHADGVWNAHGVDIPGIATHNKYFPGPSFAHIMEYFTNDTSLCRVSVTACNDIGKKIGINVGDPSNLEPETMAIAYNMDPGGSSFHLVQHWAQRIREQTGALAKFDWASKEKNQEHYGQDKPPEYDLSRITGVRLALWGGGLDLFITPPDLERLMMEVSTENWISQKSIDTYAHMDFVWGKNASKILYPDVMAVLEEEPAAASAVSV